mgnify:CR=1
IVAFSLRLVCRLHTAVVFLEQATTDYGVTQTTTEASDYEIHYIVRTAKMLILKNEEY